MNIDRNQRTEGGFQLPHIAIYARVSTAEQVENGQSLDTQVKDCLELAAREFGAEGFTHEIFREEGKSGSWGPIVGDTSKTRKIRPQMRSLIQGLESGSFTHLISYKLNRLYRSLYGWLSLYNKVIEPNGVKVSFVAERFDTSASGRLAAGLLAQVGEYERENTVENVRFAIKRRRNEGYYLGRVPYGWRNEPIAAPGKSRRNIVPCPEELTVVRRIHDLYCHGMPASKVADQLNAEGIPFKGHPWTDQHVRKVVSCPTHAGLVIDETGELVEGVHFPDRVIEPAEFHAAVAELHRRSRGFRGVIAAQPFRLFAKLATCGNCGRGLESHVAGPFEGYRCKGYRQGLQCHVSIGALALEEAVLDELERLATHPDVVSVATQRVRARLSEDVENIRLERDRLQVSINGLRDKAEILLDHLEAETIDKPTFKARLAKHSASIKELEIRRDELTARVESARSQDDVLHRAVRAISDFPLVWSNLNDDERRNMVRAVFERIEVGTDGEKKWASLKPFMLDPVKIPLRTGKLLSNRRRLAGAEGLDLRELAILKYTLDGRTQREIGLILGVADSRVAEYAARAKAHLGARSTRKAAQIAEPVIVSRLPELPLHGWKRADAARPKKLSVSMQICLELAARGYDLPQMSEMLKHPRVEIRRMLNRAMDRVGSTEPIEALNLARERGQLIRREINELD